MKKKVIVLLVAILLGVSIIGLVACKDSSDALNRAKYDIIKQTKMDNFTLLNQTAEHGQIVMCGDSIVELVPQEIFNHHNQNNSKIVFNRGISGDTTVGLKNRFNDNVLNIKPSVVTILIGTNDFAIGLSLQFVTENLQAMVADAKQSGVETIIIQSIYPVNNKINSSMVGARNNKDIISWNKALLKLCQDNNIVYADINSVLQDDKGNFNKDLTYDGLHPNAKGYLEIAKALNPYIYK